jgi:hypothetical protein
VELLGGEPGRRMEVEWHELIRGHAQDRTGLPADSQPTSRVRDLRLCESPDQPFTVST